MFTRGEFTTGDVTYGVLMNYTKSHMEILLINCGTVVSAYKTDGTGSYSYNNSRAKELGLLIKRGVKSCTSKNNTPMPFELGAMNSHEFTKVKVEYSIQLYMGEVVGASIRSDKQRVELEYIKEAQFPENIPYIKLTEIKKDFTNVTDTEEEAVQVRSVQEIALEKEDVSWLKNKKYYIVNDDATAEQLFSFLDKYNGVIAYDTETTGLHINMFGEIGSDKKKELERYNAANPENQIRADRLVGIIFCVENDVSYYFPCFNRKFDNLYQNLDSPVRKTTVNNIKARYTVGDLRNDDSFMANYIRTTPDSEWGSDVILMERCRDILHTKHLVAHNGTFEWKVGWLYHIDTNISDDTMIMHQLMYKFRSTTSNRGEKSSLKFLAKKELGVDQWELDDFFPNWKEDDAGTVRTKAGAKKKKGSKIDFSYMTYEGTRVYAPTDGDVTFQLFNKYKKDMVENHKEIEYLYSVELIVSCAIAYMEFYGHRIDETKILNAREETKADLIMIESEIRQTVGYSDQKELDKYNELKNVRNEIELLENKKDEQSKTRSRQLRETIPALTEEVKKAIAENTNNVLNLSAPGQVADLFYNKLGYPTTLSEGKMSVAKKVYKGLMKEKDENGKPKYPVAGMYAKYKDKDTQLTKFFDNLPYFMYPGGFIFSSYGQISTATGRMSCIDEDALISVVGGYKKIKDIEVGDMVYCYDNDGNIAIRKVLNKLDKGIKDCIELTWQSQGTHEFGNLVCTPDHKILSKDNGWVRADSLNSGDRVFHLRRSLEKRPRIFGANGQCEQEQLLIKKELFNVDDYNIVIHHKDDDASNNDMSNLELKTRADHSRLHAERALLAGKIKYEHLAKYVHNHKILKGEEHPKYIKKTAEELAQMLIDAQGIVTNIPMDYSTYVKKCNEVGLDYKALMGDIRHQYKKISKEEFVQSYTKNNGTVYAIAKDLGIGRVHVENLIHEYNLCSDIDIGISASEYINVYLQNKGVTKSICNELGIDAKTVRMMNKQTHCVYTGIDDNEFISVFNNVHGSVRGVAREFGITFYKASETVKRLNLCYNHKIVDKRSVGKRHVYDLEVEEFHNFIANEICVHNCSKPNAQQYPKLITKIVIPRDGFVMLDADYSQIEYRVLTALAGNTELAELFSDPDSDYHTLMASLMYDVPYSSVTSPMRSAAKSFNFGIPYGMGLGSLAILLTGKNTPQTRDEAAEKYEAYFKNQPRTRKFFDNVKELAQVYGYTETQFKRRRYYSFKEPDGTINEAKKARALRQAGNAVIQGSAADVFKIGVARNFSYIRRNNLLGKLLIINMIHDEQLMEIDAQHLNVQRVLADVGKNMQFHLDGYPPLYIGAGIGKAWGYAKGKMAEIHPVLLQQLTDEAKSIPIYREDCSTYVDPHTVLDYFENRVYEFRRKKVADYLGNPENWHKNIHPAIGGLINLQFNYGRGDEAKAYTAPDGTKYTDQQFLELNIGDFLKENHIDAQPDWFRANETTSDEKSEADADVEYSDDEEEDDVADIDYSADAQVFSCIDESNKLFGSSVQDLIATFGACILPGQHICGLDVRNIYFKKLDALIDFLTGYLCDPDDEGALQIVFLNNANILKYTGQYVKGIRASEFETEYKTLMAKKHFDTEWEKNQGDINNRAQAE